MSVVDTKPLLHKLNEMSKQQTEVKIVEMHREVLCEQLRGYFPEASCDEIQEELLWRGIFEPSESNTLENVLKRLEAKRVWNTIQKEYDYLKEKWKGPDVSIFIYPLTKHRPIVDGKEVTKNGVSYNNLLILFVSAELETEELRALFAHEYHHICRLAYLNKSPHEIELLDSLLIEGMAECAVGELYGENLLSPWTKGYSQEECMKVWKNHFVEAIKLKSVDNHFSYLYGNEGEGLPKWIGYCLGYKIVRSYLANGGSSNQEILYKVPSLTILEGSIFKF
ncbi:DUF2268 domain-containing protein [Ureibacillus sinduriensis]|uniref:DUF2268 domain-containing protein n=1 Tax=Ureibacillus sinduriensis BLB-1 = JCM 15800 TaxID=1384057 RepID=A0A0A3ILA7_9BACL|nr:DUF2268 domain-containing putative Zn-dependent protease [Ureibacillus sinduriensis]KGR75617.1 hypothetical protein CD33_10810 [Ureibacillus sinduriensis BLB-1 = JCM 15800]